MKRIRLSNGVRRAFQGSSRGMTLIEVLLALFIIGVVAVVFLSGLITAARAGLIADVRTTAESLARAQMEYVKNAAYNSTLVDGQAFYPKLKRKVDDGPVPEGYAIWSVNQTGHAINGDHDDPIVAFPWDSDGDDYAANETGLQKVTLLIKHEDEAIFTLEGYKLDR